MRITPYTTLDARLRRPGKSGLLSVLVLALLAAGCQTNGKAPADYGELVAAAQADEPVAAAALREAFFAEADFSGRLARLTELETQAMQLVEDEPLKLGSLGSAILDIYYGSLAGHYVSMKFYEFVENETARARHADWVERIKTAMGADADGSFEAPYPAVTPIEPIAFARSAALLPVGSIYRTSPEEDFILLLQARPEDKGPLTSLHFQLNGVYQAVAAEARQASGAGSATDDSGDNAEATAAAEAFSPFTLMAYLARQGDTAAQASIGAYLATRNRREDAIGWLQASSRSGNVLANNLLARVYFEEADESEDDADRDAAMQQVLDNYVHAVALGSLDAAYALGVLYLSEHYGEDNVASGLPLLQQAVAGGHPGAALFLGHLHYQGREVEKDIEKAASYYVQSAAAANPAARIAYGRFLLDRSHQIEYDDRTLTWLEELAERDSAEAMVLIGNLYGRGVATKQRPRRAVRWFERAVRQAPGDANIVNEVAWVLAVTDQPGLKRAELALELMDALMTSNEQASQTPAYLDTWAAALAANGQFERAVAVQQQALDEARKLNDPALMAELEGHLNEFEAGRALSEPAP